MIYIYSYVFDNFFYILKILEIKCHSIYKKDVHMIETDSYIWRMFGK